MINADAPLFLDRYQGETFDLIVVDPPYRYSGIDGLINSGLERISSEGLFVLEHDISFALDEWEHRAICTRKYGRTIVSIFV